MEAGRSPAFFIWEPSRYSQRNLQDPGLMTRQFLPADFVQEVDSQYSTIEARTFWSCEPLLSRFLEQDVAERWLNEQLARLAHARSDAVAWQAKEAQVHRGEGWTLSLAILDTPRRFIHLAPFLAFYAPLNGELVVDRYKVPTGFRNDVFDPSVRLEPVDQLRVGPRQILRLDSSQYAYDFRIAEPVPVVRFASRSIQPLEWLFSKKTLQAWQANDADLYLTQLRVAAQVLGKIAHQSSLEPLTKLSFHSHHAVRWAAIQNLGRINRTAALSRIENAVSDAHPHVRRAAAKTLQHLASRQGSK